MKFTLHLALCLSILLLPLCVQSKNTAGAFSVNRKFFADPEKTDSSSTEEKKDEQVEPSNANTPAPAPSVDDKTDSSSTEEKKNDQVDQSNAKTPAPAPSVDDKTEEKKDDRIDPTNTQPPAPSVDDKTEEKKDDRIDPINTQPPAPSVDDKTEEKKDDQVDPTNTQPPAPSVDDKTEEKKDDQVDPINTQPPAPSVDDKTEEKKDDQVDPINTQPPAPVDDGKTPAPLDDGDTPVPDKNTTDTSVVQPDGDKSYHLTFQQKLKFLMSPKKPWIYLISGLVGFILIAFIIFGFSRFFVDSEEQEEYNMSANVEKGRDNSKIQTLQLDFYKQTTEVQIVN